MPVKRIKNYISILVKKFLKEEILISFFNIFFKPGQIVKIKTGVNRGLLWRIPEDTTRKSAALDRDRLELHQMHLGGYEPVVQRALKNLIRPGQVCYDIGANVGFFTLLMARLTSCNGYVETFEPVEKNIKIIKDQIAVNRFANVALHKSVVSSKTGRTNFIMHNNKTISQIAETGPIFHELQENINLIADMLHPQDRDVWRKRQFYLISHGKIDEVIANIEKDLIADNELYLKHRDDLDGTLLFLRRHHKRYNFHMVQVETVSIDDLVDKALIKAPDFVKIDVEGAEGYVLEGMMKTLQVRRPFIYVELHGEDPAHLIKRTLKAVGGYKTYLLNLTEVEDLERQHRIVCLPNEK